MTIPRVLQTPVAAPAAAGTTLSTTRSPSTAKPGAKTIMPRYGMTMWFQVVVKDPNGTNKDLGKWSGCSGLSVSLDSEEVWSGGDYHAPYLVPKAISYGKVTLERAMDHESAAQLRQWLQKVADEWISSDEGGAAMVANPPGGSSPQKPGFQGTVVTISLWCSLIEPPGAGAAGKALPKAVTAGPGKEPPREVARWELRNVIPQSWQGPTMSAKSGDVAIEKLVLNHRGFLDPSPGHATPGQGRLRLSAAGNDADAVDFQYNPAGVTLERTNDLDPSKPAMRVETDNQVKEYGKLNISLGDLHIEGVQAIKEKWQKLLAWMEPVPGKPANGASGADEPTLAPQRLSLTMGAGDGATLKETVWIKQLKIAYKRFTPTGVPNRASVNLTVIVMAKNADTPTGAPGPQTHTVTGKESLPQVTADAGGKPQDWRGTAEKNNIDNPAAVRSGDKLTL
jgi:phage tail-like protein